MARVLLVDDDPDQLEIRKLLLGEAGHLVSTAASATEATAIFSESDAQLVIMDLRMPRAENGLALIRELRARSSSLRILVLSGWATDLTQRPEAAMVDQVLSKPVPSRKLLRLISELV